MSANFGDYLQKLRLRKKLSLREICAIVKYDPSNWSKIERNVLEPPLDDETLNKWAQTLGFEKNSSEYQDFFERAYIAKGLIPKDLRQNEVAMEAMPAMFRKLRKKTSSD